jgi:tRNA pseudouridine32 synthase/23S rRNA pseudouridine746 synthase
MKSLKQQRDEKRKTISNPAELRSLEIQSIEQKKALKNLKEILSFDLNPLKIDLLSLTKQRDDLVTLRKDLLNKYQDEKYGDVYLFNYSGRKKSLTEIFSNSPREKIPMGSGHCAAPKLLQFAYQKKLKPLALAEFWWGKSPAAEIRTHKNIYPACNSRCKPILTFMLEGLNVEKNPLLENHGKEKEIEIVYQDEHILVINKPPGLLSVPGKSIKDSVQSRLKILFPTSTIVHRLDQETSGLMVLALSTKSLKSLQKQFISKLIKKKYIAVLEGNISPNKGVINLPLRGDYDDLPRQIVCVEHGKEAITRYEVQSVNGNQTRIAFEPITGRSHQLRVHSAHSMGLGIAIRGDTIYGIKDKRLYLHAQELTLKHPLAKKEMIFTSDPQF